MYLYIRQRFVVVFAGGEREREGKGREGKGREGKGREGDLSGRKAG